MMIDAIILPRRPQDAKSGNTHLQGNPERCKCFVQFLIKAFVRQSGTLAASRPSDNSLAPGAQPPLA